MRIALIFIIFINVIGSLSAEDHWWQFRGPDGDGHASSDHLPLTWNQDENIAWKTAIHDRGWSSPVIFGNQIWLTTSTEDGHQLFALCINRDSGKIIHDIPVFKVESPQRIAAENTYASPTPVIEEGRVYVHYGTYGTACLDTESGEILWTRRDLKCDHEDGAGPNSSPFLFGDLFIVNVDGRDVQYIIALDKATGETAWKTDRSLDYSKIPIHQRKGYTMPILMPRGNSQQLVSPGGRAIYSYDPVTGQELWRATHRGWSIAPRPVYGHGLVFVVMDHDHPELWAVDPNGSGDVAESHVKWKETKTIPARSSPLLVGDLLFLVNRAGIVTCLEAETGKLVWKNRLEGKYSTSPIYGSDRIYFFNENSLTTVVKPSRKFGKLAVNRLPKELMMASPAVAGDSLFLRTENHLYRIEDQGSK